MRTRRKVSYIIRNDHEGYMHTLGVNSLALDTVTLTNSEDGRPGGILYTAGRDGVVAAWDLNFKFKRRGESIFNAGDNLAKQKINGRARGDSVSSLLTRKRGDSVSSFRSRRTELLDGGIAGQLSSRVNSAWELDADPSISPKSTFRASAQAHTDWVNDILLCHNSQAVVSASSDRTIKLWRPHGPQPTSSFTLGSHTDYVKCLTYASDLGWIASGGFDKKISIWDVKESRNAAALNMSSEEENDCAPKIETVPDLMPKSSIYALATNPSGSLLVSGSPEKIVRLWDPRSGQRVMKLTGHTDNIRAVLISDDGKLVLSGSSDTTIKLWSVAAGRCFTTYETHSDSIWTLYSSHPRLQTFFAGSRDGLVTRTELILSSESDQGDEDECVAICKENSGVVKVISLDDKYIWTATSSSSVNRWIGLPPRNERLNAPRSLLNPEIPFTAIIKPPSDHPAFAISTEKSSDHTDHNSLYIASAQNLSVPVNDNDSSPDLLIPLRSTPDMIIEGSYGLTRHITLNNRRHVLSLDTAGEVMLWDIVKCKALKKYGKRNLEEVANEVNTLESVANWCSIDTKIGAVTVQLDELRCFDAELYADEAELVEDFEIRDDQRINLGKWILFNLFTNFTETVIKLSNKELEHQKHQHDSNPTVNQTNGTSVAEHQLLPMNINLAMPVIPPATATSNENPSLSPIPQSPGDSLNLNKLTSGPLTAPPSTTSISQPDYFSNNHNIPSTSILPVGMTNSTSGTPNITQPPPAAIPTSGNLIYKLKGSMKKLTRTPSAEAKMESAIDLHAVNGQTQGNTTAKLDENAPNGQEGTEGDESLLRFANSLPRLTPPTTQDFPPIYIPPNTTVIISEESPDAGGSVDLYRGTVGGAGAPAEIEQLHEFAPPWLLDFLLRNKTPVKEPIKISFVLRPHDGSGLKELPNGNGARLTANRMLRVRKLLAYVVEKLELDYSDKAKIDGMPNNTTKNTNSQVSTSSEPTSFVDPPVLSTSEAQLGQSGSQQPATAENNDISKKPELWLELLCGDQVVHPIMTLATIRQHIYKQGGDLPFTYRYRDRKGQLKEY